VEWLVLLAGLSFPAVLALIDCFNRDPSHFKGGTEDRQSWLRWLVLAVFTAPVLIGNGILLSYYWAVIKRNAPGRH
jgi:hypothetical protein